MNSETTSDGQINGNLEFHKREGTGGPKGTDEICKAILTEKFPNLMKALSPKIQEP